MGFVWDLIQQHQLQSRRTETEDLESRVATLEKEVADMRSLLNVLLERLEARFGEDVDGDGRIG